MLQVIIIRHFIFLEKIFQSDLIVGCEEGETIGMHDKIWMTAYLFKAWIDDFLKHVKTDNEISLVNCHLLILDGHASHVTMDVMKKAWLVAIDLFTFSSHTSHAMQPLDVSCFKPFKIPFQLH